MGTPGSAHAFAETSLDMYDRRTREDLERRYEVGISVVRRTREGQEIAISGPGTREIERLLKDELGYGRSEARRLARQG